MELIPILIVVVFVGVLFGVLRQQNSVKAAIQTCLQETGDHEQLKELLKKKEKGLRALGTQVQVDDIFVRLARMEGDTDKMAAELAKMNSRPAPLQLDYLWGIDRWFYALATRDGNDLSSSLAFVNQVADAACKRKKQDMLCGMKAVTALVQAKKTEAAMTPLLNDLFMAFGSETGFSKVEQGWILSDLRHWGITITPIEESKTGR